MALLQKEKQGNTPSKFYSIVLWKTQNQQNKKLQNGNLVALRRNLATMMLIKNFFLKKFYGFPLTIIPGGNANIKPKHLSFLIGGTGKILTAT
ncbi:hypothetical protein VB735_11470 [Halotia wernerae UHCC 0503]|nr:hypothetical protein [Halotia wernerae UHCC 0503]